MKSVFILMTMTLFAFALAGCTQQSQTEQAQTEESSETPSLEPARYEIEANDEGYVPAMVHAKAGQEVTLVFTRTTDKTCATEVVMPSQDIEVDLPLNEPVEVTFVAGEEGEVDYHCGMDMFHGKVMVD